MPVESNFVPSTAIYYILAEVRTLFFVVGPSHLLIRAILWRSTTLCLFQNNWLWLSRCCLSVEGNNLHLCEKVPILLLKSLQLRFVFLSALTPEPGPSLKGVPDSTDSSRASSWSCCCTYREISKPPSTQKEWSLFATRSCCESGLVNVSTMFGSIYSIKLIFISLSK